MLACLWVQPEHGVLYLQLRRQELQTYQTGLRHCLLQLTVFIQWHGCRSMAVQEAYHDLNTEQPDQHVDVRSQHLADQARLSCSFSPTLRLHGRVLMNSRWR